MQRFERLRQRHQRGFAVVSVAVLVAAVVFSYLVTMYGSAMHGRKLEKQTFSKGALTRITDQVMATYRAHSYEIETDGEAREAWLSDPARWLAGVNEHALTGRVGIAISPVRQYGGDLGSAAGQFYAFTRAVVYILGESQSAATTRPAFDADGTFFPCGDYEATACPHSHLISELPTAIYQADRLEEAIRQVSTMASRLGSYFSLQVNLDPMHEMGINHFRDPFCMDPEAGDVVPYAVLPCLTGFEAVSGVASSLPMELLLTRIGFTAATLNEFRYPWPKEGAGVELELANEQGAITGSSLTNSEGYPFSMAVRLALPWPTPAGEPQYVVAYALQP